MTYKESELVRGFNFQEEDGWIHSIVGGEGVVWAYHRVHQTGQTLRQCAPTMADMVLIYWPLSSGATMDLPSFRRVNFALWLRHVAGDVEAGVSDDQRAVALGLSTNFGSDT